MNLLLFSKNNFCYIIYFKYLYRCFLSPIVRKSYKRMVAEVMVAEE